MIAEWVVHFGEDDTIMVGFDTIILKIFCR